MSDEFELKSSLEIQSNDFIFEKKEFIKIVDTNGGNYPASQISFNMPSISNNDMYASLKQSYLEIPYVITINSSIDLDDMVKQSYCSALKGSFANLINGISLQIDNNNIINFTDLSNIPMHYKILSQFSENDIDRLGNTIGFGKDSVESINYATAKSVRLTISIISIKMVKLFS
jgi:hypothetical protein